MRRGTPAGPLAHLRTFGVTLMIATLFGMTYLVLFTLTALGTGARDGVRDMT